MENFQSFSGESVLEPNVEEFPFVKAGKKMKLCFGSIGRMNPEKKLPTLIAF